MVANLERVAWEEAQSLDTFNAYDAFLARYGDGRYGEAANAALERTLPASGAAQGRGASSAFSDRTDMPLRSATARLAGPLNRAIQPTTLALAAPRLTVAAIDRHLGLAHGRPALAAAAAAATPSGDDARAQAGAGRSALFTGIVRAMGADITGAAQAFDRVRLAATAHARALDDEAFAAAQRADTPAAYQDYLRAFPEGRHAPAARGSAVLFTPYGLDALPSDVAQAVRRARAAAAAADEAAQAAMIAGQRAESAAERARASAPGHVVRFYENNERYDGAYVDGRPEGFGVYAIAVAGGEMHYYAGSFRRGSREGYGLYSIGAPTAPGGREIAYAGQWAGGAISGRGVMNLGSGATISGEFENGVAQGYGVATSQDGRFEGEWVNDSAQGFGVFWDPEGRPELAGRWENHVLVEPAQAP